MRKEDGAGKAKRSLPVLAFGTQRAWKEWLGECSATSKDLWLKIAKKGSGIESVRTRRPWTSRYVTAELTARRRRSTSSSGCRGSPRAGPGASDPGKPPEGDRANGAGQDETCGPRRGRAGQERRQVGRCLRGTEHRDSPGRPPAETGREPGGRSVLATLDSRNRYAILFRIQDSKRPETHTRRIEKFVAMLVKHEKLYS